MADDFLFSPWPALGGLIYLLVVCSLLVLAAHRKKVLDIHDRAIASRELRRKYLENIQQNHFSTQSDETETT